MTISWAQYPTLYENDFPEGITAAQRFSNYLDTANIYTYGDQEVFDKALNACHIMLDQGITLHDTMKMSFVLLKIYECHGNSDALCAYKVLVENRPLLDSEDVLNTQVSQFKYLESFTYMTIGDLEAAQIAAYQGMAKAKEDKDTLQVINNLTLLAELFALDNDYEVALTYGRENLSYQEKFKLAPSTCALNYQDMSYFLSNLQSFGEAKLYSHKALKVIEKNQLDALRTDIYYALGRVCIELNQIDSAEYYLKLGQSYMEQQDDIFSSDREDFKAKLFATKKMFPEAIASRKKLIANLDSSLADDKLYQYQEIHKLYSLIGRKEMAYDYLLKYQDLKTQIDEDERRQKTNYLKIKYETEEKIKDNAILKAELYKRQAESNLLYGGLALAFVLLFGLFAALYQKSRYSKTLEKEVSLRTENLKLANDQMGKTNVELEELNRILSHDLKEPLRGIVSFSELAGRDSAMSPKTQEYIAIVNRGGKQLDQLIDDVNILRQSKASKSELWSSIDLQNVIENVVKEVQRVHSEKSIQLSFDTTDKTKVPPQTFKYVMNSLIDNATKFNENNLVQISVDYKLEGGANVFHIKDNGIGMSRKYHEQIFGMFKRLHNREDYNGSGLGLSIARQMMESIDGHIRVYSSAKDEGTTFEVSFPVSPSSIRMATVI